MHKPRRRRDARAFHSTANNLSKPGNFIVVRRPGAGLGIIFGCPCGCGQQHLLYLEGGGNGRPEHRVVDGEWPKVTLSPSIGIQYDSSGQPGREGVDHWRGNLREGVFVEDPTPTEGTSDDEEGR